MFSSRRFYPASFQEPNLDTWETNSQADDDLFMALVSLSIGKHAPIHIWHDVWQSILGGLATVLMIENAITS